jgi:hypothetical protein
LPHDHHLSVTHKMANDRSAKKSVANYKIPRESGPYWIPLRGLAWRGVPSVYRATTAEEGQLKKRLVSQRMYMYL